MKKNTLFFVSILFAIISNAQRKTTLEFGVRWRVTPISLQKEPGFGTTNIPLLLQTDSHLSGLSLIVGIKRDVSDKLTLGYRLQLRYDELYAKMDITNSNPNNEFVKGIMLDHSIYALHRIFKNAKMQFKMGLGFSFNNINTEYSYNYLQLTNIGTYERIYKSNDLKFETIDFPFCFDYENITLSLTPSITLGTKFWTMPNTDMLLLNLSAVYKLKLSKK